MPLDQREKAVRCLLPGEELQTPSVLVSVPLSNLSGVCKDGRECGGKGQLLQELRS